MTPTDNETLKLSRIYRSTVNDIEDIVGVAINHDDEQRLIEVLGETVGAAMAVVSQHCPVCDSSAIKIVCADCTTAAGREVVKGYIDEPE